MSSNKIKIPSIHINNANNSVIDLDKSIKQKLFEIKKINSEEKDLSKVKDIKEILESTDILINDCQNASYFHSNRNGSIIDLIYEYHKLSIKYETYKIENKIEEFELKVEELTEKQNNMSDRTNNMVYTVLSFIASFSVISAGVTAVQYIKEVRTIVIFMLCMVVILLTALIALDNFYKAKDKTKGLENNYTLWKMLIGIIIIAFLGNAVYEVFVANKDIIIYKVSQIIANI